MTGGGRGLGRGIALALAEAGFDLVLGWVSDPEAAAAAAAAVSGTGRRVLLVPGDVADPATATLLLDAAVSLGGPTAWVNNAGVSFLAPVLDTDPGDMARMVEVNLMGTFHGLQAAGRWFSAQGWSGRIVNLASDLGVRAWPLLGGYAATKFAVVGLTQAAAVELAPAGITVNAVCPGTAETDMVAAERAAEVALRLARGRGGTAVTEAAVTEAAIGDEVRRSCLDAIPAGRFCTPADVGGLVAWLCGPSAAYVTGQAICVNGGSVLH